MRKLIIIMVSVVLALGISGCSKETGEEVITTCVMTTDSGTEITHRIFYTGKVATKMETTSKIDLSIVFAKSYRKAFTETDKERFGDSVVTSFNMVGDDDYITTVYDLSHPDAYMIFEYFLFYQGVDVKNKDGSYSSKKILDALKNFEKYKFTCDN